MNSPGPIRILSVDDHPMLREGIADAATEGNTVHLPSVEFQPLAADDVASAVAKVATGSPLNATVEVAGPEQFRPGTDSERL